MNKIKALVAILLAGSVIAHAQQSTPGTTAGSTTTTQDPWTYTPSQDPAVVQAQYQAQQAAATAAKTAQAVLNPEPARTLGNQLASQERDSVQDVYGANKLKITNSTETQTLNCPVGMTGSIIEQRNVATDGNGTKTYGPWTTVSNTCTTTTVSTETQTLSCPVGQTGAITEQRTVTTDNSTGAITYGPWSTVSNTCVVAPPVNGTETQTIACPAGQSGTMTQTRTVSTVAGITTYGAWTTTSSNCVSPTGSTETQTLTCPAGQIGSIVQTRTVSTLAGVTTYGAWTTTSNSCVTPPTPPTPIGASGQNFYFGGLGSPTGVGTFNTDPVSGSWAASNMTASSIDLNYSGNVGSLMGLFSGTCTFSFGAPDGSGSIPLSGPCGNGWAYGWGVVSIAISTPYYTGSFSGSWSGSGANGAINATLNSGISLYTMTQGGSNAGFVMMDGSGNFSGYNNGNYVQGYLNGNGEGAVTMGGGQYLAALKAAGQFGTLYSGSSRYAVGGQLNNFFAVDNGGSIFARGSIQVVSPNDPSWQAYFTNAGIAYPSGFNAILATGGTYYPGVTMADGYDFGAIQIRTP